MQIVLNIISDLENLSILSTVLLFSEVYYLFMIVIDIFNKSAIVKDEYHLKPCVIACKSKPINLDKFLTILI